MPRIGGLQELKDKRSGHPGCIRKLDCYQAGLLSHGTFTSLVMTHKSSLSMKRHDLLTDASLRIGSSIYSQSTYFRDYLSPQRSPPHPPSEMGGSSPCLPKIFSISIHHCVTTSNHGRSTCRRRPRFSHHSVCGFQLQNH